MMELSEAKRVAFQVREFPDPQQSRAAVIAMCHGIIGSRSASESPSETAMVKKILDELVWKFSESSTSRTYKRVGCPFWSLAAIVALRDAHAEIDEVKGLTQHEHVFPRSDLVTELLAMNPMTAKRADVQDAMMLKAIGCVVLKSEHSCLNGLRGEQSNPWIRYSKASVIVARNECPPESNKTLWRLHMPLIEEAGILGE